MKLRQFWAVGGGGRPPKSATDFGQKLLQQRLILYKCVYLTIEYFKGLITPSEIGSENENFLRCSFF